ncbi:MAG: hypothetical protein IKH50_06370, partial [Oscillospiraceae bacterium]|nr:hypothetical protein [Oscillospiraceae bacterium]
MAKKKMELMYKNLHVSYLEMVNTIFSDSEKINPSVVKEFERFGYGVGMFVNEDPYKPREGKNCLGVKKKYLFPPVELEKTYKITKKVVEKEVKKEEYMSDDKGQYVSGTGRMESKHSKTMIDTGKEEYGEQEYVQYMVFTDSDGSEMCVTRNISLSEDSIKGISEFYYYVDPSWDGNKLSDSYKDLFPAQSIKFSFMRSGYIVFRSGEYRLESSEKRGNIFQAEISEPQLLSDSETDILNNYFTSHDLVEVNTDIAKLFSQDMKFCIYVPDKEKLVISFYRNRKLVNFADENDEHVYMLADAEQLDALYDIASQYESVISD